MASASSSLMSIFTCLFLYLMVLMLFSTAFSTKAQDTSCTTCKVSAATPYWYQSFQKLIVFGDSYVDTGNMPTGTSPWKEPYGMTYPGVPAGRLSDGRVLTDFVASAMGLESPIPYNMRNQSNMEQGINFAYDGSGVFSTNMKENLSVQISHLEELLTEKAYTVWDIQNSLVLVSTGANDYSYYAQTNGTKEGLPGFTKQVVDQLANDLLSIHSLGVKRIAVTNLAPIGCLPIITQPAFNSCIEEANTNAKFHNQLLDAAVGKLNSSKNIFVMLDFYGTFFRAFDQLKKIIVNPNYTNPLNPCCSKLDKNFTCMLESVCDHPELSFFFDWIHPSQNGWHAVFLALTS